MVIDLGETIVEVCTKVKGGILVFFPSYSLLNEYKVEWAKTGFRKKIKEKT
jgi:Rad3-related DNA helicase